jgi:hypothetical protein
MYIAQTANYRGSSCAKANVPKAKPLIQTGIFVQGALAACPYLPRLLQRITSIYATIVNYPERELRYMDAGE